MSPSIRRTVIYSRVSLDASGEGRSNDRQESDCRAFADLRSYEVVEVCRDVSVSAYDTRKRRPGWEQVLDLVRAGEVDIVLAWRLDRITRTTRELLKIIDLCSEHNVALATVEGDIDLSSATGRAFATVHGAIAQLEVETKAARQKAANAQRRAEGQPWRSGWASFGYDRNKNVVPDQAEMIKEAAEAVLNGASLKSIARKWRESGVTTPRSSKGSDGWTHNGVKSILLNPVNAGINTYKGGEIGKGAWDPILSEGTLRQLQALLGDPQRRTNKRSGRQAENLLSGIATCATCGHPVQAGTSNGNKVYKCSNRVGDHLSTNRSDADQFVLDALTSTSELFASHAVLPEAAQREGQDDLFAQLAALDRRERVVTEQFSAGTIEPDTWTLAVGSIKAQREGLSERIAQTQGEQRTRAALAKARIASFLGLSLSEKRVTLRSICTIELHPRERRRGLPIEQQVSVWSSDARRLSPLIAGSHPSALARRDEIIAYRESEKLDALGDDVSND